MAISVNPMSYEVTIPQADLTLVEGTLYELNVNTYRLWLKAWEDDSDGGMTHPKTNTHYSEYTVAGTTYSRAIIWLPPYNHTFEDGAYSVRLAGANTNLWDIQEGILNQNQVQVIPQNSAGLITSIEARSASFGDVVTMSATGESGTDYPKGNKSNPVDNLSDAKLIAENAGYDTIFVKGNWIFLATDDIDSYRILGQGPRRSTITIPSGCSTTGTEFENCTITGTLDAGGCLIDQCHVDTLSGFNGIIQHSVFLAATVTLAGSGDCHYIDCRSGVAGTGTCTIDMNGTGRNLGVRGWIGGLKLTNLTGSDSVSLDFVSGHANLDSTVTAGTVVIRGGGVRTTLNQGVGCTVVSNVADNAEILPPIATINDLTTEELALIRYAKYEGKVTIAKNTGVPGTAYPIGTPTNPVNNILDAKTIITTVELPKVLYFIENYLLYTADVTLSGFHCMGLQKLGTNLKYMDSISALQTKFENCTVSADTGVEINTSSAEFVNCLIGDSFGGGVSGLSGDAINCLLGSPIGLDRSGDITFTNCSNINDGPITFEFSDTWDYQRLHLKPFGGDVIIKDMILSNQGAYINLLGGTAEVDSTCTTGEVKIRNASEVIDNSGVGCTVDVILTSTEDVITLLNKYMKNKKTVTKFGNTWHLLIYDTDDLYANRIVDKELKDKDGNDISDVAAEKLAQELKSSV